MIDCDVHQTFRSLDDLLPYLPEVHREHIVHGGYSGIGLPEYHWTHPEGFWRRDAVPEDGGPARARTSSCCGDSCSTPTRSTTRS